jgi:CBS domain-containing protein
MTVEALLKEKSRFVPIISSNVTIGDVIDKLEIDKAAALVVTDDNETILGIITERDIARGLKKFGRNVVDKPVGELMTRGVRTCELDQPVEAVLRLMDEYQIHYVPITRPRPSYRGRRIHLHDVPDNQPIEEMTDCIKTRLDGRRAALAASVSI